MSAIKTVLARLDGVKERAAGKWIARCPAHEDKRPSLSIREADDGKVLLTCFAGCLALEIVQSIGMEFADLFPDKFVTRVDSRGKGVPRLSAGERLELLEHELTVAAMIADAMVRDGTASADEATRLALAAGRVGRARYV